MTRQLEIAGTERAKHPAIDDAIEAWLEAKYEQKLAVERTKLRHESLLLQMQEAGVDRYPFVDRATNKERQVVIARDPKAKTQGAPRQSMRDDDAEIGDEVEVRDADTTSGEDAAVDNVVEMRRVKRETVEDEIDPFGSVRSAMDIGDDSDAPTETYVPATPKKRRERKAK